MRVRVNKRYWTSNPTCGVFRNARTIEKLWNDIDLVVMQHVREKIYHANKALGNLYRSYMASVMGAI